MKLVYIYTALTSMGGVDRVLSKKANYFADECGYDVYIITDSQAGRPSIFPLSQKVKHIDINTNFDIQYHHGLLIRTYYYFTLMYQYKKRLIKILKKIQPDFVLTTLGRDMDFLPQIKDGSIKIGESHIAKNFMRNFHLMEQKGFPYKQIAHHWRKKQEKAIKQLNTLVVLTPHDAKSWESIKHAEIIPNPIPFIPQKYSTCTNKQIISVGRLSEQKGFERLIEAWAIITTKHPDWRLTIYGEGEEKNKLEQLAEKKHIKTTFNICQPTQDIENKYIESSIYVMSSRFEGLPMVLIEAKACGLPCISFDCPHGPSEIIKHNDDGLLIENGNIEKLADAINYLIEHDNIRINMGKRAQINSESYSPKQIMSKWVELFSKLKNTQE